MLLNTFVQKVHVYAGLQATVALFLFSLSIIVATFPGEEQENTDYLEFTGIGEADSLGMARALHDQIGRPFEKLPQPWMVSEDVPGVVVLNYYSVNGHREVQFTREERSIRISTVPSSLSRYLEYMHQESIGRRNFSDSLWLWAWSLYIEFSVIAMFLLPITGVYIWLSKTRIQRWAQASLILSSASMMLIWNLIR